MQLGETGEKRAPDHPGTRGAGDARGRGEFGLKHQKLSHLATFSFVLKAKGTQFVFVINADASVLSASTPRPRPVKKLQA